MNEHKTYFRMVLTKRYCKKQAKILYVMIKSQGMKLRELNVPNNSKFILIANVTRRIALHIPGAECFSP